MSNPGEESVPPRTSSPPRDPREPSLIPSGIATIQYSDIQLQHMCHNAVTTIGNIQLTNMLDAFEAILKLPEDQQYKQFTEFNAWIEDQKAKADTLIEMSMVLILRNNLHLKANVTTKQMEIDNRETLHRVEKNRESRQKAIDKIRQFWKFSRKGISLATIVIMSYGTKFHGELAQLARMATPDEVLEVVNGELIRRLTSPPKPGVRVNKHLMPSEFKKAIKILNTNLPDTIYRWDDEVRKGLRLQYNMVGMLGEASADYSENTPPAGDSVIELLEVPKPAPNEEELANLARWKKLGAIVVDEDENPMEGCLMDKIVLQQDVSLDSDEDTGDIYQLNVCECDDESLKKRDWYLALGEKYIAKQIGWMIMVELVRLMPEGLCGYHLCELARVLGFKAARVSLGDILHRLHFVYKHRNCIGEIRISDKYYQWFKISDVAIAERKKRLLGTLKYQPIERSTTKPKIMQTRSAALTSIHQWGCYEPETDEDRVLNIATIKYKVPVQDSIRMYCHHNQYGRESLGFAHHCYFYPMQQASRQDVKLWWHASKMRMDQEFRLITIPFPAIIIQGEEEFDHTFVHGNAKELYVKGNLKHTDHITAYVIHSAFEGKNRSRHGVGHGRLRPGSNKTTNWRQLAMNTLGKDSEIFEKGYFQDITTKRNYPGYTALTVSDHFVESMNESWSLVSGGDVTTFKPLAADKDNFPFAASVIPYTAVRMKQDGTIDPLLENGMKYESVRQAHRNLEPIFDKNVTAGGQYEIREFPVECHLITQNPVEQALVGGLSWDDQSVLNEAARLLAMEKPAFNEWYAQRGKDVKEQYLRAFMDSRSIERGYNEKSYFRTAGKDCAEGMPKPPVAETANEGDIEFLSDSESDASTEAGNDDHHLQCLNPVRTAKKRSTEPSSTPKAKKQKIMGPSSHNNSPKTPRSSTLKQLEISTSITQGSSIITSVNQETTL